VSPLLAELVCVGVEKGLGLAVLDPVLDTVGKGLPVLDPDPDLDPVLDGVIPGVTNAVGDSVTVADPVIDPVRVLERVGRGEGVPD
jgi:hypothetical protein